MLTIRFLALTTTMLMVVAPLAQAQSATRMKVRPESQVILSGDSNIHGWSCTTHTLQATISVDSGALARPLTDVTEPILAVTVAIPVESLKCGKGKMDDNLYKALNAREHPDIRYVLRSYRVDPATSTADTFSAATVGDLTVAGTTQRVEIPLQAERLPGGAARGEGSVALRMTDFGVKPPTALLGTLRTRNEIEIRFEVLLDRDAVVALSR